MISDRSRRHFFGAAAVAAAWPLLGRMAGAEPATLSAGGGGALKLGVASYSMRAFTLDQALDMAKQMGVKMGGGTITIPNDPAKIKNEFEYAKNAGFPLIFVDPEPAALDTIEQMAKTYDIKVAIHNHGPEDKRWPRPQDAYAAVKSRDKRLGLCVDIGHTLRTGTDPIQACRECRDRLYDMHVKDLAAKSDKESQVEVGRGVIDFPALFKTLIDIGYQGQVGLEYEIKAKDPLPGMIESMAYMRGVLAAVAVPA